jgi:predicted site-specific integrase-resolvase
MEHEQGTDLQLARALAESVGHVIEEDAAALARVKPETLEAWRKRGKGPAWVRWGNRVMYPREAIREFLQGQVKCREAVGAKGLL